MRQSCLVFQERKYWTENILGVPLTTSNPASFHPIDIGMSERKIEVFTTKLTVHDETSIAQRKLARRRSIVRDFSLNTSTHGVPGIARSRSICNRLFWIIATSIFSGAMLYFVIKSITNYFDYPTQTSVSVLVERSQPFPAVSICNYSPIRFDRFIGPFLNYTNSRNLTNTTDNSTIRHEQANFIRSFIQDSIHRDQSLTDFLFPLEAMLFTCMYNDRPCSTSDFLPFLSAIYGLCYTFNAKRASNQRPIRITSEYGNTGKLVLKLYAHSHQYVPYSSDGKVQPNEYVHVCSLRSLDVSVGMVTLVHDNTELPLIDVAGIQLTPGKRHKLSYKKRIHRLLSSPYTECTEEISPVMRAYFDQYQGANYSYSQELCNMLCIQAYV